MLGKFFNHSKIRLEKEKRNKHFTGETYRIIFGKTEDFSGSFLQEDLESSYRDLQGFQPCKHLPGNPF